MFCFIPDVVRVEKYLNKVTTSYFMEEDNDTNINEDESVSLRQYEIISSANDFNILTLFNFIESGVIEIPGFQRNYIWDQKRASKLIESFIIGLPVPQIFLYEKAKNKFLVIDGQQRLMTIYYFMKQKFPRATKRAELRKIFSEQKGIPGQILHDPEYFTNFSLNLPNLDNNEINPLNGQNYNTLIDEHRGSFNLRPIRNIIIRQLSPPDEDSSIYEIFNRLNSGGLNLQPQEIRMSLYPSYFYDKLNIMNNMERWRELYGKSPHPRMKDVENILRIFAFLTDYENYKGSLNKFLNEFSRKMKSAEVAKVDNIYKLFTKFLEKTNNLDMEIFFSKKKSFNVLLFEAVFYASCKNAYKGSNLEIKDLTEEKINLIKNNPEFISSTESETGKKHNVEKRFKIAREIMGG